MHTFFPMWLDCERKFKEIALANHFQPRFDRLQSIVFMLREVRDSLIHHMHACRTRILYIWPHVATRVSLHTQLALSPLLISPTYASHRQNVVDAESPVKFVPSVPTSCMVHVYLCGDPDDLATAYDKVTDPTWR